MKSMKFQLSLSKLGTLIVETQQLAREVNDGILHRAKVQSCGCSLQNALTRKSLCRVRSGPGPYKSAGLGKMVPNTVRAALTSEY